MATSQNDEYEAQSQKIASRMAQIKRKILVMSGKGGVGKTTVTVSLAEALADMGFKVGVLDTDIHGPNVAKMLGCEGSGLESQDGVTMEPVQARENLVVVSLAFLLEGPDTPVIWRGSMKNSVIRQFLSDVEWGALDYLLIDSPPGTGDEQLAICQSITDLTGSIIVTTPQSVAILDARKSVAFSHKLGVPVIGVIENMSGLKCPECGHEIPIFGIGGGKTMCDEMSVPFLGRVPMELSLREAEDEGENFMKDSAAHPSKDALNKIAYEIGFGSACTTGRDTSFLGTGLCRPEACASCSSNCGSRKEK